MYVMAVVFAVNLNNINCRCMLRFFMCKQCKNSSIDYHII